MYQSCLPVLVGTRCQSKADVAIAVDASLSVTEPNFKLMLRFVSQIIRNIGVGKDMHRFSIITYHTYPEVQIHLKEYIGDEVGLEYDLLTLKYDPGRTNIAALLQMIREDVFTFDNGDRLGVPNLALVLTDGISNVNRGLTESEAVKCRDAGIDFIAVGIAVPSDYELKYITDDDKLFLVNDFAHLDGIVKPVSAEICI